MDGLNNCYYSIRSLSILWQFVVCAGQPHMAPCTIKKIPPKKTLTPTCPPCPAAHARKPRCQLVPDDVLCIALTMNGAEFRLQEVLQIRHVGPPWPGRPQRLQVQQPACPSRGVRDGQQRPNLYLQDR